MIKLKRVERFVSSPKHTQIYTVGLTCVALLHRNIGAGFTSLLLDKQKLTAAVAGATLLALGVYGSREGTKVAGKAIDRQASPPLVLRTPK